MECAKRDFVEECGEVLAKAVDVSVNRDPRGDAYIFTAKLLTEPGEGEMATMGGYGRGTWTTASTVTQQGDMVFYGGEKVKWRLPPRTKQNPVVVGSFHRELTREINEWLKI